MVQEQIRISFHCHAHLEAVISSLGANGIF